MRLTVEELLEIDSAREAAISPDGRAVAFRAVAAAGGVDEVRVVSIAGVEERELVPGVAGRSPAWSPSGEFVAYFAPATAPEGAELRLLSIAEGTSRRLFTAPSSSSRPAFSPGGGRLAFIATSPDGYSTLTVVSLAAERVEARIEARPGEAFLAPSWSPDGEALAFGRAREGPGEAGPTSAIEVWEMAREPRPVETGCAYATCPSWSPDGGTLAFVGVDRPRLGAADPALRPWLVGVGGGVARPLGDVEGAVLEPVPTGPAWAADGRALYLRLGAAGAIDLIRLDLVTGAASTLISAAQVLDFSRNTDGAMACTVIAADDPGSVQVLADGGIRRVERSGGAWARRRAGAIPIPAHRTFGVADRETRDGWVVGVDRSLSPQPTLLAFHGGPHGFFGPGFQGGHFHRAVLAANGWVVLTVNSIGSGTYGREFADGLRGAWGERDLPEQLAALDALVAEGIADPSRLAVAGYSYGGYLAAWAIAHDSRFAAAVIGAPIVDLESFERTSDIGSWYTPWQMKGPSPENRDRYRRLSPLTHADKVTTPTLILHGEADARVPFAQGEMLRDRLVAAGRAPVELVSYPDAGHLFYSSGKPAQRLHFNRRVLQFLEANIDKGAERG